MRDERALAGLFTASGVLHLVRPETFAPSMPGWVPAHREVIVSPGVVELACAAGLLHPRSRSVAGWASLGLLLAVFPANLQMALDASRSGRRSRQAVAFGRLPLQLPLLRSAYRAAHPTASPPVHLLSADPA